MLRGAFIGFGNVAANGHLPGWRARDDAQIVAAADAAAPRREAFLAACPEGRQYRTVDDLLASEALDFVDICAPPGAHAALIEQALQAGLHVMSEKPLVTRLDDAERVSAAAARSGRVVHTVHNWLHAPVCVKVSTLIGKGAIGAVRSVRWRTLRTKPAVAVSAKGVANWRVDPALAGGGVLFDHGWHALYCVMRWAGVPRALAARLETRRFHEQPLEDTATLDLDTDAGASRIFLTWAADERSNTIDVEGEKGEIRVAGDALMLKAGDRERRWTLSALSDGSHHPDWFGGVAADFLAAVGGAAKGNLDEAVLCARLIDAAQRSSAAGGARIDLPQSF